MHASISATVLGIWCAGCATGEEAYSIAISLLERLAREDTSDVSIQLFGTDAIEQAIEKARAGVYAEALTRSIAPDRLARFFTRVEGGGYRILQSVRERCTFVKHDLASDPPFSRLDLVSCRNVLIYFGQELQRRVVAAFHFALNEPGFLLLGHAENLAEGTPLFSAVDRTYKIFARTPGKSALRLAPARDLAPAAPRTPYVVSDARSGQEFWERGNEAYRQGALAEAISAWQRAADRWETEGALDRQLGALLSLGHA